MQFPYPLKCEKCGRPATFKFLRVVHGKTQTRFFCEEHAAEESPYLPKPQQQQNFAEWLKNAVENVSAAATTAPQDIPDIRCRTCGLTFEAYKRTLLLGCPDCYASFEEHLVSDLRKFHGDLKHVGRRPDTADSAAQIVESFEPAAPSAPEIALPPPAPPVKPRTPTVDELRGSLKEAVKNEDFEMAARLRDQIRALEHQKSQS